MNETNSKNPNDKPQNESQSHRHHQFQVQITPDDIFPFFKRNNDSYAYVKHFFCNLPQNIIPPKSFHYPFSLDNFCKTDLLTMNFDLQKHFDILTDPKLNTPIHQDFINNTLELLIPGLTDSKTEKTSQLREKILEIVERNDESVLEKKNALSHKPFYLRTSTYLKSSLNVRTDLSQFKNQGHQNDSKNQQMSNPSTVKKKIEKSFYDAEKVKIGFEHPSKKGVTAKAVYSILPMEKFPGSEFIQYVFPIDPNAEVNLDKKFETPKKFLMINEKEVNNSKVLSLFKQEQFVQSEKTKKEKAKYFSHEKNYTFSLSHDFDLFNRYLIFKNEDKFTAKFAPLDMKITLKKYKKAVQYDENEIEENKEYLNIKRERDYIVVPKEVDQEGQEMRNEWYKHNGFDIEFKRRRLPEIDYQDIELIKSEKEKEREYEEKERYQKQNKEEEEEDFEGDNEENNEQSGEEETFIEKEQEIEDKEEKEEDTNKNEQSQDNESGNQTPKANEDDEDDALFGEDDDDNSKDDNKDEKNRYKDNE